MNSMEKYFATRRNVVVAAITNLVSATDGCHILRISFEKRREGATMSLLHAAQLLSGPEFNLSVLFTTLSGRMTEELIKLNQKLQNEKEEIRSLVFTPYSHLERRMPLPAPTHDVIIVDECQFTSPGFVEWATKFKFAILLETGTAKKGSGLEITKVFHFKDSKKEVQTPEVSEVMSAEEWREWTLTTLGLQS